MLGRDLTSFFIEIYLFRYRFYPLWPFCYNESTYEKECGYYAELVYNYSEKSVAERLYMDYFFNHVIFLYCSRFFDALYIDRNIDYDLLFYISFICSET